MLYPECSIELKEPDHPYVGRGGVKLAHALDVLGIEVAGKTVLDVGASTGGFTHCCLTRGARKVFALDVGHGQLAWELRNDPRVVLLEKVNIRHFDLASLGEPFDLALVDISFISAVRALETLAGADGPFEVLVLVKPNFELEPADVGKGGVVRDEALRKRAVTKVVQAARALGFEPRGEAESPIRGAKGNVEIFARLAMAGSRGSDRLDSASGKG